MKSNKSLVIGWLYPELMNVYGDRGNIICLIKRAQWRGIKTNVLELNPGFDHKLLSNCNLLIMGGAQDKQQTIVNKDLVRIKNALSEKIDNGTPGLYVCGGFQFLGKYYKDADGSVIEGLGIFDLHTENPGPSTDRLIGNIAIQSSIINQVSSTIVGFENHGGRTILGKGVKPLGKIIKGFGNNNNGFEGAVYKNSIGTYMHGPILPKNPDLADYLISKSLKIDSLQPLDNSLELQARSAIAKKLQIEI